MNPFQEKPDPRAFVKSASFEKVLAWFKAKVGLTAPGGTVATLPTGGKIVRFPNATGRAPFTATAAAGGMKIAAGFIGWAGRTIYIPEAVYSGTNPGGVFVKINAAFVATANAPGDPWDIVVDDSQPPTLVWRSIADWTTPGGGGIGEHARIFDDSLIDEDIRTTTGTVYLPVATQFGSKIVQDFATAIDLYYIPSGAVRMSERPGN